MKIKNLYSVGIMPFWTWFSKYTLNYNGNDTFTDYQIGNFYIRKYKSYELKNLWLNAH